jgi:hypothetical protein
VRGPTAPALVVLALSSACEQPPYEPNWLFHGQWIDIDGRDREPDETCAGSFEYLDRYAGALAVEFGVDQHLGSYRWYSPEQYEADSPCGDSQPYACAWHDGADTPLLPHEHEVVHLANFLAGECPSSLTEGLAVYYSASGSTPDESELGRLPARLEDPSARIPDDEYAALGRFVGFLVERFGLDAILEVCVIAGVDSSGAELAAAIESVLGVSPDSLLEDFRLEPHSCNSFERHQSRVYACGLAEAAPDAGIAGLPGQQFEIDPVIDCASESTAGPLDGDIWITHRIDLAADGDYSIALQPASEGQDISEVRLILAQCQPCAHERVFEPGEPAGLEPFEAGRYWLEVRAPKDFQGMVKVMIGR